MTLSFLIDVAVPVFIQGPTSGYGKKTGIPCTIDARTADNSSIAGSAGERIYTGR